MKILALVLLLYSVGATVAQLPQWAGCKSSGERVFWAAAVAVVGTGALACVLAMAGMYSFWLLFALVFLLCLGTRLILMRKGASFWQAERSFLPSAASAIGGNKIAAVLLMVAALLYGLFPSTYLWGGRDYGLYMINAVHITHTGSVQYDADPFVAEYYEELKDDVAFDYPALFLASLEQEDKAVGVYDPQFLPGFTAMLAVGYDVGGFAGLLCVNGVISLLAAACLYLLAKRYFCKKTALIALGFLVLCPAQLWGARITQSEQLAQLLFLMAAYLFGKAWEENSLVRTLLASLTIAWGCFVRMDNYIVGLAICAVACYAYLWQPARARIMTWAVGSFGFSLGLSLWYGFVFHNHYYITHWEKDVLKQLVFVSVAVLLAAVGCGLLRRFVLKRKLIGNPVAWLCQRKWAVLSICGALAALAGYGYFIRPLFAQGLGPNSLIEYCWYLSPLVIPLAILGLYAQAFYGAYATRFAPLFYLIATGLASVVGYSISPSISPDHFWASRRWVPVNFPFLLLFAAAGIVAAGAFMARRRKGLGRAIMVALSLAVGGYMAWQCRLFVFTPMLAGLPQQYEALARRLPDDEMVFTNSQNLASVLRIVYHKPVYLLHSTRALTAQEMDVEKRKNFQGEALRNYVAQRDSVLFVGNLGEFLPEISGEKIVTHRIAGAFPEEIWGAYPKTLLERAETADIFRLTTSASGENFKIDLLPHLSVTQTGVRTEDGVASQGTGTFMYGPYLRLQPGRYRVTADLTPQGENGFTGALSVISKLGAVVHETVSVATAQGVSLEFTLTEAVQQVEITLRCDTGAAMCKSAVLEELDA